MEKRTYKWLLKASIDGIIDTRDTKLFTGPGKNNTSLCSTRCKAKHKLLLAYFKLFHTS
jgi:hypothetical protein